MLPLREQRKIILIVTDGVPDRPQAAVKTLHVAQDLDFEVYGVGIQSDHIALLLPQTSRVINDLPDLASTMFGLLQQALLKGGKNE